MSEQTLPRTIGPDESGTHLVITWEDGHRSAYEPRQLRLLCPCAGCVDEMTGAPILEPDRVAGDVHPLAIRYVGRYALAFDWSDGHRTGIYPFPFLRDHCPCLHCDRP